MIHCFCLRYKLTTRPEGSQYKLAFHSPLRCQLTIWFQSVKWSVMSLRRPKLLINVMIIMIIIMITNQVSDDSMISVRSLIFMSSSKPKRLIEVTTNLSHSLENKLGDTIVTDGMYWSSEVPIINITFVSIIASRKAYDEIYSLFNIRYQHNVLGIRFLSTRWRQKSPLESQKIWSRVSFLSSGRGLSRPLRYTPSSCWSRSHSSRAICDRYHYTLYHYILSYIISVIDIIIHDSRSPAGWSVDESKTDLCAFKMAVLAVPGNHWMMPLWIWWSRRWWSWWFDAIWGIMMWLFWWYV